MVTMTIRLSPITQPYPVDLDVVQLLVPLHDVLHAVHPGADVPHQHRLAHVLHQAAQGPVQGLQQLLDGPHVLLVRQHWGEPGGGNREQGDPHRARGEITGEPTNTLKPTNVHKVMVKGILGHL